MTTRATVARSSPAGGWPPERRAARMTNTSIDEDENASHEAGAPHDEVLGVRDHGHVRAEEAADRLVESGHDLSQVAERRLLAIRDPHDPRGLAVREGTPPPGRARDQQGAEGEEEDPPPPARRAEKVGRGHRDDARGHEMRPEGEPGENPSGHEASARRLARLQPVREPQGSGRAAPAERRASSRRKAGEALPGGGSTGVGRRGGAPREAPRPDGPHDREPTRSARVPGRGGKRGGGGLSSSDPERPRTVSQPRRRAASRRAGPTSSCPRRDGGP